MRGCILDAGSLGSGVDLQPLLATLPKWSVWEATAPADVSNRIADAEIVLTNKVPLCADDLVKARRLRYVSVLATGTNIVDLTAAESLGVRVSNVRDYASDAVAQHAMSLMLALAGNLLSYAADVDYGRWAFSPYFCLHGRPIFELKGKTLTIVGFGSQGRRLATLAEAFGMVVQVARRPGRSAEEDCRPLLAELLPVSDILSFHCPLTPATQNLLHAGNIYQLKPGALVINCARGGIVDEEALAAALACGHLGGAALDVATVEPLPLAHPLTKIRHPNFIITPHIAWASIEARRRLLAETVANIEAYCAGLCRNAVIWPKASERVAHP